MLFGLAIVLGIFESTISGFMGLPPGIKLGLANVVVLYALYFLGAKRAVLLVILKAGFAVLTRGAVAGILSFSGGMLSFLVMALLLLPKKKVSILMVSIAGAIVHNLGQFIVAYFILGLGTALFIYFPILLVSGIVMGVLTATTFTFLIPALKKMGIQNEKKSSKDKAPEMASRKKSDKES